MAKARQVNAPERKNTAKGTPKKLLGCRKVKPEFAAIYAKNQGNSRLLNVPPEVRNRIWNYVLGGHTIHIDILPYGYEPIRYGICARDVSAVEEVEDLKAGSTIATPYHARHHQCIRGYVPIWYAALHARISAGEVLSSEQMANPSALLMALLHACRQIYEEAALLAFSENTFSFEMIQSFQRFAERLIPAQANALQRIVIGDAYDQYAITRASRSGLMRKVGGSLSQLMLFISIHPGSHGRAAYTNWKEFMAAFTQHNEMPIKSVKAFLEIGQRYPAVVVPQQTLRQWEENIEKGIVSGSVTRRSARIAAAARAV